MNSLLKSRGRQWVLQLFKTSHGSIFHYLLLLAAVVIVIFLLRESRNNEFTVRGAVNTISFGYLTRRAKTALGQQLRLLAINLAELQHDLDTSKHEFYKLGEQVDVVNSIIKTVRHDDFGVKNTGKSSRQSQQKQEVCPEKFLGKGLGFAPGDCKDFVPMRQLITLLMYAPKEFSKPAMSYFEMMQGVEKYYPETKVILATSKPLPKATTSAVLKLNIKFMNHVTGNTNQGEMWSKLLAQVNTPYVLVAPRITHFDKDIDLYRLVRLLSYNDDVAVAGGSYRNRTAQWDLGCQQVSFNYWTAKYSSGYYRSFNDCIVCDFLPGPFAAKTKVLKELGFDNSLSSDTFHDLFWRLKYKGITDNVAVVCSDVMFNIDTPSAKDKEYTNFADKHEIKKMVEPDGRVRWYGCKRGFSHTKGKSCSWLDGMGAPPCDLYNLGEAIRFTMTACEEANIICEYAAGTVLGAVKFGSVIPWEKDADIHFYAGNFTALATLKSKFEAAGFKFDIDSSSYRCCIRGRASGGQFEVRTTKWHVSLYGRDTLEAGDMLENHKLPTKVPMAGAWVTTPRNPGLFARNHYVYDYFRHSEHHGGDSFYEAGSFKKCPRPGHSACLDQYLADGNMQFLDYVP